MEAAPAFKPLKEERPLDQLQDAIDRLYNGEPLREIDLYKLFLRVQQVYGDAFPTSNKDEQPPLLTWIDKGGPKTFREMWENNEVETDGEEGFRDLCLRTLKENDPQKQRLLLEEMSRRLKDDMFSTEKGDVTIH